MLDPQAKALIDLMVERGLPPTYTLTPTAARAMYRDRRGFSQPKPRAMAGAIFGAFRRCRLVARSSGGPIPGLAGVLAGTETRPGAGPNPSPTASLAARIQGIVCRWWVGSAASLIRQAQSRGAWG